MTRMETHCRKTGTIWRICVSGEPLGMSFVGTSTCMNTLEDPGSLPTEESVRRVSRAFGKWVKAKFPDKVETKGGYFVAFADGAIKVAPSRKPENETIRRKNGNCFGDQGEANLASQALAWLCRQERERFENAVQSVQASNKDRLPGSASSDQTG